MATAAKKKTTKRRLAAGDGKGKTVAGGGGDKAYAPPPIVQAVEQIAVGRIAPSPHNRRVDEEQLESLIHSIDVHGLQTPIMVRPRGDDFYEIVSGERRWRACRKLDVAFIACIVRDLDERQAQALRLIENRERLQLDPIEEGDAVAVLLGIHNDDVAAVAAELGATPTWVRRRARLPFLSEKWRAVRSDPAAKLHKVVASVERMEILASLPAAEQDAMLEANSYQLGWCDDAKQLRRYVREWLKRLDARPWGDKYEAALPKKQRCSACTRRSDSDGDLFAGMDGGGEDDAAAEKDVFCLDSACWRDKTVDWLRELREEAEARAPGAVCVSESWADQKERKQLSADMGRDVLGAGCWEEAGEIDPNDEGEYGPPRQAVVVDGDRIGQTITVRMRLPDEGGDDSADADERRAELARYRAELERQRKEREALAAIFSEHIRGRGPAPARDLLRLALCFDTGFCLDSAADADGDDFETRFWAHLGEAFPGSPYVVPDGGDDRKALCGWLGLQWDPVEREMERRLAEPAGGGDEAT